MEDWELLLIKQTNFMVTYSYEQMQKSVITLGFPTHWAIFWCPSVLIRKRLHAKTWLWNGISISLGPKSNLSFTGNSMFAPRKSSTMYLGKEAEPADPTGNVKRTSAGTYSPAESLLPCL